MPSIKSALAARIRVVFFLPLLAQPLSCGKRPLLPSPATGRPVQQETSASAVALSLLKMIRQFRRRRDSEKPIERLDSGQAVLNPDRKDMGSELSAQRALPGWIHPAAAPIAPRSLWPRLERSLCPPADWPASGNPNAAAPDERGNEIPRSQKGISSPRRGSGEYIWRGDEHLSSASSALRAGSKVAGIDVVAKKFEADRVCLRRRPDIQNPAAV